MSKKKRYSGLELSTVGKIKNNCIRRGINNGDEVEVTYLDPTTKQESRVRGFIDYRNTFPSGVPIVVYRNAVYDARTESLVFSYRITILPHYLEDIVLLKRHRSVIRAARSNRRVRRTLKGIA